MVAFHLFHIFIPPILVLYSLFIYVLRRGIISLRRKKISRLLLYNLALLYIGSILFLFIYQYVALEFQELVLGFFFLVLSSFVVTVEAPGYLYLSSYDSESIRILKKIRKSLVSVTFDFEPSLKTLKKILRGKKDRLESIGIFDSLHYLVDSIERIKNVNMTLLNSTLNEVNWMIREISQQSKHPFPTLIELFSLTGLSFLLALLLRELGI